MKFNCSNMLVQSLKQKVFLFLFLPFTMPAQVNLVPDSGFEKYNYIPDGYLSNSGKFNAALPYWYAPTDGTPDYHSRYSTNPENKIPYIFLITSALPNCINYQETRSGGGYVGFFANIGFTSKFNSTNEYIQTRLTESLKKNHKYVVSFYINKSHCSYVSYSNIGAYLSKDSIRQYYTTSINNPDFTNFKVNYSPQILTYNAISLDTVGWTLTQGIYKSNGQEKWVTIGHFNSVNESIIIQDTLNGTYSSAYYLVDDVSVYEQKGAIYPDTVCQGESFELSSNYKGPYQWFKNGIAVSTDSAFVTRLTDQAQFVLRSAESTDTFSIAVNKEAYFDPLKDSSFCSGDSLVLVLPGPDSALHWSDSKRGASRTFRKGGTYSVERRLNGCSYSDTFFLDQKPVPDNPGVDQHEICRSDRVAMQIRLYSPYKYLWLDDLDTSEQKYIKTKGVYRLRTIGDNHCYTDTNLIVPVLCEPEPWIPSAFVPKGVNTKFAPKFLNVKQVEMSIYDRWGELLYQESGESVAWDGSFKGEICTEGIYVYRIRYIGYNGREYSIDGVFGLIW